MSEINVALIGCGFIGQMHAKAVQNVSGASLKAVCSRSLDSSLKFARDYHIPTATTDLGQILNDKSIDAVIIATPNVYHAPYAIQVLEAGKDVMIEKPMAMNAEEASQIALVAKALGRLVMVGHMWRFDREVQELKKIIDQGSIGTVIKTKGYGIHVNWGPSGWFSDKKLAGGGALIDMGVHAIDTVRYLMGDPKPLSVYATLESIYQSTEVDDSGILFINWDNGARSIIESGWWHPHTDGPEASTQLFGTKGYARLFPTKYKVSPSEEWIETPRPIKTDHCDQQIYDQQMVQFIDDVRTRRTCVPGTEEGTWVMKIVDAAYKSSSMGEIIQIDA